MHRPYGASTFFWILFCLPWIISHTYMLSPSPPSAPCRIGSEDTRLMLWDTAGQEEFDAITKAYYRGICSVMGAEPGSWPY